MKSLVGKNNYFLIFLSVITLIVLSIGQTPRWTILEPIQMADRFEAQSSIYPDPNDSLYTGASVYFPGVSILAIVFKQIFPDEFLLFIMQLTSCLIVIAFFFIQYEIVKTYQVKIKREYFFYWTFIFYFYLNFNWLIYALEFKPDTIAYCLGSYGLILSRVSNESKKYDIRFFTGAIITGISIVFKQQYLFFLLGLFAFSIINGGKKYKLFSILTLVFSFIVLFVTFKISNSLYWTITVLSDDGLISIYQWIYDHYLFILNYFGLFFLLVIYSLYSIGYIKLFNKLKEIIIFKCSTLIFNVWSFIGFFVFIGALVSSIKVGGNSGNTAFGLVVLFPISLIFLNNFKSNFIKAIFFLTMIVLIPSRITNALERIIDAFQFKKVLNEISINNLNVLTGSNTYFAIRGKRKSNYIYNYWMFGLKHNIDPNLSYEIKNSKFEYLVVENTKTNVDAIKYNNGYNIIFKNNTGLIAKHK